MAEHTGKYARLRQELKSVSSPWERLPILIALTRDLNNPDHAQECAQEALTIARALNDPFWIACSLRALGMRLFRTAGYSETLRYLQEASGIFEKINDWRMKAQTDLPIVRVFVFMGRFDEAMLLLVKIIPVFESMKDANGLVRSYRYFGDIYKGIGEHDKSIENYRHAIAISVREGIDAESAFIYQDLAIVYQLMEDHARQRKYLFKSLDVQKKVGSKEGMANALANIANMYLEQDSFSRSEKYVRESGQLFRELGMPANEAIALSKLAMIHRSRNEYEIAFPLLDEAVQLLEKSENHVLRAKTYEHYAVCCLEADRPQSAVHHMSEALRIAMESGYVQYQYQIHSSFAQMYETLGDPVNALLHQKEYTRIKEEYINTRKIFEAGRADMKVRLRTVARQLKRERLKNDSLQRVVEEREASLVSLTLNLIRDEEAEGKKGNAPTSGSEKQKRIDGNWDIFASQFHKVHYDFYGKILQAYPDLTPAEVKVCSLIRIGLATKQIADILCVSKRTVDTHRGRIHKKLNLGQRASLASFIAGM